MSVFSSNMASSSKVVKVSDEDVVINRMKASINQMTRVLNTIKEDHRLDILQQCFNLPVDAPVQEHRMTMQKVIKISTDCGVFNFVCETPQELTDCLELMMNRHKKKTTQYYVKLLRHR